MIVVVAVVGALLGVALVVIAIVVTVGYRRNRGSGRPVAGDMGRGRQEIAFSNPLYADTEAAVGGEEDHADGLYDTPAEVGGDGLPAARGAVVYDEFTEPEAEAAGYLDVNPEAS